MKSSRWPFYVARGFFWLNASLGSYLIGGMLADVMIRHPLHDNSFALVAFLVLCAVRNSCIFSLVERRIVEQGIVPVYPYLKRINTLEFLKRTHGLDFPVPLRTAPQAQTAGSPGQSMSGPEERSV